MIPTTTMIPACLAFGFALGLAYFQSLWWQARRLAAGTGLGGTVALMGARFVTLAALLALTSLAGTGPLLAAALGVLIARFLVMRRVRLDAP